MSDDPEKKEKKKGEKGDNLFHGVQFAVAIIDGYIDALRNGAYIEKCVLPKELITEFVLKVDEYVHEKMKNDEYL